MYLLLNNLANDMNNTVNSYIFVLLKKIMYENWIKLIIHVFFNLVEIKKIVSFIQRNSRYSFVL